MMPKSPSETEPKAFFVDALFRDTIFGAPTHGPERRFGSTRHFLATFSFQGTRRERLHPAIQ